MNKNMEFLSLDHLQLLQFWRWPEGRVGNVGDLVVAKFPAKTILFSCYIM